MAYLRTTLGKYNDAIPLYKQAISILKKCFGPINAELAQAENDLAWIYFRKGNFEEAESMYISAYNIRQRILGEGLQADY